MSEKVLQFDGSETHVNGVVNMHCSTSETNMFYGNIYDDITGDIHSEFSGSFHDMGAASYINCYKSLPLRPVEWLPEIFQKDSGSISIRR